MKVITVQDIADGIQLLYEQGIVFSQNFIHVRGNGTNTGVEEKINVFLNWLPVSNTQAPPADSPSWIPLHRHSDGVNVIQEGHHSAVAFAVMQYKDYYPHKMPTETKNFGELKTDHIFIGSGAEWYLIVLKDNKWVLFNKPVPKPLKYGRIKTSLLEYKNTLGGNRELVEFLLNVS